MWIFIGCVLLILALIPSLLRWNRRAEERIDRDARAELRRIARVEKRRMVIATKSIGLEDLAIAENLLRRIRTQQAYMIAKAKGLGEL